MNLAQLSVANVGPKSQYPSRMIASAARRSASGWRSGQLGAEPAGCHADLPAKGGVHMALVGEPGFLRDQSKGLIGSAHQGLRPLEPALHDVMM